LAALVECLSGDYRVFQVKLLADFRFNLNVPIFRVAFALFFIYAGISILVGGTWTSPDKDTVLSEDHRLEASSEPGKHNVLFGQGTIDF
jgi:hypothetical protein